MNFIYIFIYILQGIIYTKALESYTMENVLKELTTIDKTIENQQQIREKNKYNEIFCMKYKLTHSEGFEVVHNIYKSYLNAYSSYSTKYYKFNVITTQKENEQIEEKSISIFDHIQSICKFLTQEKNQISKNLDQNSKLCVYNTSGDIDKIKDQLAESKITLIDTILEDDDDFALYLNNLVSKYGDCFEKNYQYILINLKFTSFDEKKKWLETFNFHSFYDKKAISDELTTFSINRNEIQLPFEISQDDLKNYNMEKFVHDSEQSPSMPDDKKCIIDSEDWILNKPLSYSYFHKFDIVDGWSSSVREYKFVKKYYKPLLFCSDKIIINCIFYTQLIQFYIIRYCDRIYLEEFFENYNLCEVFLDIICVKDNIYMGETSYKYIADLADIDTPFNSFYLIEENKEELVKNQEIFYNFISKVNDFFTQSFSTYNIKNLSFGDSSNEI